MAHAVMPYKVYEGVRELTSLPIPTALLSNRSKWQMDKLLSPSEAVDNIKFPEHRGLIPFPVFTYPQDEDEGAFAETTTSPAVVAFAKWWTISRNTTTLEAVA